MISKSFQVSALFIGLIAAAIQPAAAQTNFTIIKSLGAHPDGAVSYSTLVHDSNWTLYGATDAGGTSNQGTVFTIKLDGSGYKTLHSFAGPTDGVGPYGGLLLASDGKLYGTTLAGGVSNAGTVFSLQTDGAAFTVLYTFTNGTDSGNPEGGVIEASDGMLYGTASSILNNANHGTVFKINKSGSGFSVIHSFVLADGVQPQGRLIQGSDGNLFGTAPSGGSQGAGSIFRLGTDGGGFTNLHSFLFSGDGTAPQGGVIEASDHSLYGTTYGGGGTTFNGTIYKINKDGNGYQTVFAFPTTTAGLQRPNSELTEGTNGALYGGTDFSSAPNSGAGGIFMVGKDGNGYVALRIFETNGDGQVPKCALLQSTNGAFYGTTKSGGTATNGCIFALSSSPLPSRISSLITSASSNVVQFTGTAGIQYDVLRSTNLSSWSTLTTLTSPPSCQTNYSDPAPPKSGAFYQIHQH